MLKLRNREYEGLECAINGTVLIESAMPGTMIMLAR